MYIYLGMNIHVGAYMDAHTYDDDKHAALGFEIF